MKKTKLVGILNITPDSFSDGGAYNEANAAARQLELMLEQKPDVIDIGAVSTRPNSIIPSLSDEKARFDAILSTIIPILKKADTLISIDSYNYETILYLLDKLPIAWINDQSGFADLRIIKLAKDHQLKLVIMHHLSIPVDPSQTISLDLDVVQEVKTWLLNKTHYLIDQGVDSKQIILDPGIGFGKTPEQSWQLIKEAKSFTNLGYEVMYGHSRKSFLNTITNKDFSQRDFETAILSGYLANYGVDYLRVHNVELNIRALKLREFII